MGSTRSPHRAVRRLRALALLAGLTLACGDDPTGNGELSFGELTLDASDPGFFTYVTLSRGGGRTSVADPLSSLEWDIAFRQIAVKLNGGVAGPGQVAGANLMNHASADSATVVDFTGVDADAAWNAVTAADIAGATFQEDGIVEDFTGPWFDFSPEAGTLVANPGAAWKVALSGGGYAVLRVVDLNMAEGSPTPMDLTIEFRHQRSGWLLGARDSVFVDLQSGTAFVDLTEGSVVAEDGCNWDLSVDPNTFGIALNDSCGAGTFPLDTSEDFTAITDASKAPEYGGFLSVLTGAFPSTVDDATGVFWHDLQGDDRMWPTYNVFLVRVGAAVYKVQITDYYSATGAAGHPTVRFEQLQ